MIARLDPQSLLRASGGSIILCGRSIDMSADEITGGCLCGDVRFYASGPPRRVTHCHCDMCRRAVSAVVATFATFESSRVDWRGQLARYDSSDRAWRGFCARCGSSLCFGYKPRPERIYVTLGAFDDPNAYPAGFHDHLDQKLSWLTIDDHLPTAASAKHSADGEGSP